MPEAVVTPNIHQRIEAARKNFKPIVKDRENPFHKNMYATLDNIVDCVQFALFVEGLRIENVPDLTTDGVFVLRTRLVVVDTGEFIESVIPLTATKSQEQGSAITYARRYALTALLNLCVETDDDGNVASGKGGGGGDTSTPKAERQAAKRAPDVVQPKRNNEAQENVW